MEFWRRNAETNQSLKSLECFVLFFLLNISESCFILLPLCSPSFSAHHLHVIIWCLCFFQVMILVTLRDWSSISNYHFWIPGKRLSLTSFGPDVPVPTMLVPTWIPRTYIWRMGATPWEREDSKPGTCFKKILVIFFFYLRMVIPAQAPNHPGPVIIVPEVWRMMCNLACLERSQDDSSD